MTRNKCLAVVRAAGCSMDESDGDLTLDAPRGRKLAVSGAHCYVVEYGDRWPETPTIGRAYSLIAAGAGAGLIPCDDGPDCETCTP